MLAIAIALNWHDENFKDILRALFGILLVIFVIECLSQASKSLTKNEITAFNLIIKESLICFGISLMSFLIVMYGLLLVVDPDAEMTKIIFNTLVSLSFLLTFVLYCIYQKYKVPEVLERLLYRKVAPTLANEIEKDVPNLVIKIYKEKVAKEKVAKYIDLITIFATVFLLGNSTFATINSTSTKLDLNSNPFDSLEFFLLVVLIPFYVQSAYHRTSLY